MLATFTVRTQTLISFSVPDAMTIYTKGQSNRLSIGISIDSKEIYHRAEFLGRKNGYYFRGTLRKVYQLGSGKKTDQFPIAGFWFQDEIEFGKRDVYEKLRSKYETMSFSRMSAIYFTARRSHHALRFDGTFYGNGLPEQAWTNDIPFLFIEFDRPDAE